MSRDLFQNRFLIPSARAAWHDYNGGIYFVTICTAGREHYFGEITNSEMRLSEIGRYTDECINNIPQHNPYADVPLYVVMPNHIHAIVVIDGDNVPSKNQIANKLDVPNVETMYTSSQNQGTIQPETMYTSSLQTPPQPRWKNENVNEQMQSISHQRGLLSTAIGGLKRAVTCFANQNNIPFGWQSRFHDHIIRHIDEMNRIAEYIETNVLRWESDEFYC